MRSPYARIISEKQKEAVREANRARVGPWKGKHLPLETRIKLRDARLGHLHWNWKGGITDAGRKIRNSMQSRAWRRAVIARDNNTCQECGSTEKGLHVHHIKPFSVFPNLRFEVSNGITLCARCHRKTDSFGGIGYPQATS